MASNTVRRPLPALISLLALLLLTGIVWWRVISRDGGDSSDAARCPSPSPSSSQASLPARDSVDVLVLNSTQKSGLAGRVRRALAERGFATPAAAANTKPLVRASAQLRYGPSGKQGAQLLKYYLPGSVLVPTQSRSATVVVAVGAQYRGLATEQQVGQALAADKLTVASGSPVAPASSDPAC